LRDIGFVPQSQKRFYLTGTWTGDTSECGPDGASICNTPTWSPVQACNCDCIAPLNNGCNWAATVKVGATALLADDCPRGDAIGVPAWVVRQSSFTMGAAGNISSDPIYDIWQVDERKNMINLRSGL
jgi:hypothetical protein